MMRRGIFTATLSVCILLVWSLCAVSFELSADMVTKGKGTEAFTGKLYLKGQKHRMEMQGQDQFTIFRQDKNVMWIVMPDQKTYMEMPFDPKQKPSTESKQAGEISRKLLGKEIIDGHSTEKYEITVQEGSKTHKLYQWIATDLNFGIKQMAIDGTWSVEYKNIKTSVPDSMFEIPAGYQKMSVPSMPGMGGGMGLGDMKPLKR